MRLVFGYLAGGPAPFETVRPETSFILAFQALPLILVISALAKLLYHWGVLQTVVAAIGWVLQRSLGVTGPVGTSAAANVFVGMVEAPLLVRPYLATMSRGGLFATMTVGMAGVAGTVLAIYATVLEPTLPGAAGHLIVASVISVPAALMLAELMVPDGRPHRTSYRGRHRHRPRRSAALQHGRHRPGHARGHRAAGQRHGHADRDRGAGGAGQPAARLRHGAARPEAHLRADAGLGVCAAGLADRHPRGPSARKPARCSASRPCSTSSSPICSSARLPPGALSDRSRLILTYALCGFANFGSLGIMIGGMVAMVPARRAEIVSLGAKTIVSGTLATLMTAAVVGAMTPG